MRNRKAILKRLAKLGFKTPVNGTVEQVANELINMGGHIKEFIEIMKEQELEVEMTPDDVRARIRKDGQLVIYMDRSIKKVSINEGLKKYKDKYCTEFVDVRQPVTTMKYLQIGNRGWWLKYVSQDWNATKNPFDITVLGEEENGYNNDFTAPMFALEFIGEPEDGLIAIDYNNKPKIPDVIKEYISDEEIKELVKNAKARKKKGVK